MVLYDHGHLCGFAFVSGGVHSDGFQHVIAICLTGGVPVSIVWRVVVDHLVQAAIYIEVDGFYTHVIASFGLDFNSVRNLRPVCRVVDVDGGGDGVVRPGACHRFGAAHRNGDRGHASGAFGVNRFGRNRVCTGCRGTEVPLERSGAGLLGGGKIRAARQLIVDVQLQCGYGGIGVGRVADIDPDHTGDGLPLRGLYDLYHRPGQSHCGDDGSGQEAKQHQCVCIRPTARPEVWHSASAPP